MKFTLKLNGYLCNDNDAYELIKQYNQLIKYKQYLEQLWYSYNRFGGWNYADTKQEIEELIDEIDRL